MALPLDGGIAPGTPFTVDVIVVGADLAMMEGEHKLEGGARETMRGGASFQVSHARSPFDDVLFARSAQDDRWSIGEPAGKHPTYPATCTSTIQQEAYRHSRGLFRDREPRLASMASTHFTHSGPAAIRPPRPSAMARPYAPG